MKRIILFLLTIFILSIKFVYAGFEKTFGGTNADEGYSVQQTIDGGYIIVGSTFSFGSGGADVYLIKTDPKGNIIWTKTFGGTGEDRGYSVQKTSDGGYIIVGSTSSYSNGIYLIKTDSSGNKNWTKIYGAPYDIGYSVQQTLDGGYVITGVTYSYDTYGDVYLIKVDSNGNTNWTKTFGLMGSTDDGRGVQQTLDGGYIIVGFTTSFGSGGDVYVIKTDPNGNLIWQTNFGGYFSDIAYSIQKTKDGGYIIVGRTEEQPSDNSDIFLTKTGPYGEIIWTKILTGVNNEEGKSVQQTIDGGYIIAGTIYYSGANPNEDVYLVKVDFNGNIIWTKTFGGTGYDFAESIQQTSDGGYIIVGSTTSFGGGYDSDVYLIKVDPEGEDVSKVIKKAEDLHLIGSSEKEYRGTYVPEEGKPLTLTLNGVSSGKLSFKIFTLTGEQIFDKEISCENGEFKLDVPKDIAAGVYIIKVDGPKFSFTKKIAVLK